MEFSLFYFSGDGLTAQENKYDLLLNGARFADEHDFTAIWTPERHFDQFGGLYPNPAITSAALATITRHVRLRAGSVVQPLQNALRVAEAWAMIDNLSGGRVAVAFASGWHVNDFVLAPSNYPDRHAIMYRDIEVIQQLWAGESVTLPNGAGEVTRVRILPRPVQKELPIWITALSDETFIKAGECGFSVLTNVNHKTTEQLAEKVLLYRNALDTAGRGHGHVTVMTHTFVVDDPALVDELARPALRAYLSTSVALQNKRLEGLRRDNVTQMSRAVQETIVERAVDRLISTVGLIGTPDQCMARLNAWEAIGVDEIACLIDFGVPNDSALASLTPLTHLKNSFSVRHKCRNSSNDILIQKCKTVPEVSSA